MTAWLILPERTDGRTHAQIQCSTAFYTHTNLSLTHLCVSVVIRCELPPSFCNKMVDVMTELQRRRSSSRVFHGKDGFITPRDLFRWADRKPDSYQSLAEAGYMLLGERLRQQPEQTATTGPQDICPASPPARILFGAC